MKFVAWVMGMKWAVGARQSVACCQPKGTREEEISEWGLPGLFLLGIYEKHNSSFFFQLVEGSSQGHKDSLPTRAPMIPTFMMLTVSGLSRLMRRRYIQ